jgi:hypothetical protein
MREVFKKVTNEMANCFFGFEVLLSAVGAIAFFNDGSAVKAGFIMAKEVTAQAFRFFLKIEKNPRYGH